MSRVVVVFSSRVAVCLLRSILRMSLTALWSLLTSLAAVSWWNGMLLRVGVPRGVVQCAVALGYFDNQSMLSPGAGTDPEDGLGLCFASSERLLQTKAYTYLATHFLDMAKATMYPNVDVCVGLGRVECLLGLPNDVRHNACKLTLAKPGTGRISSWLTGRTRHRAHSLLLFTRTCCAQA